MLTVITGSMFAEKSTELQRRGRRFERAGKKVIYFKPDFDTRYSENEIVTHSGSRVEAVCIPTDSPYALTSIKYLEYDVFLIDEVQFFHSDMLKVIDGLLNIGKIVIVAGLDRDFQSKPFYVTANLMAMAEEVVKLRAVCSGCGGDAWGTYRLAGGTDRHVLGAEGMYTPLCRKCFTAKTKRNEEN